MKILFSAVLCLFFCSSVAFADEGDLFDLRKRTQSGIVSEVFSGKPVVSFAPMPQKQEKFIPTPHKNSELVPFLTATNIFGQESSFPYLTHFPYFFTEINILSDGRVSVTEKFQLVVSQNDEKRIFFRQYLKTYQNMQTDVIQPAYTFISVRHNGRKAELKTEEEEKQIRVYLPNTYIGLHMYEITYHIDNILESKELLLSLSGTQLLVPVERFSGKIRFPSNAPPREAQLVFGINNVSTQKGIQYLKERETLAFKIERIVPEGTDVRMSVSFDDNAFSPISGYISAVDFFMKHLSFFVVLISMLLWIGYAFLQNRLSKRTMKEKAFVLKAQKRVIYTPELARFLIKKKVDEKTVLSLIFSLKQKGVLSFSDGMQKLVYEKKKVKLSHAEKKLFRILFSKKEQADISEKDFKKYVEKTLKREVWFSLIRMFVSLTRQMWLMGALVFSGALAVALQIGFTWGCMAVLIVGFLMGAFLFVRHSGFLLYIKQSYQGLYVNLGHFSPHTPNTLVLKMIPLAVALDLTDVFSPMAPKETPEQFSLTEQENLLLNKIKVKRNKK